ncbi:MAG: ATP-binding protein [Dehalococcoidia bacterium]
MHPALPRFLATLMSRSGGEVAYFDRDGRCVFVSESLAAVHGLPADAHTGRTVDELLPSIAPQMRPLLAAALRGEATTEEVRGVTANESIGERIWLEHWFPVHDDDDAAGADAPVIGAGVAVTDVTEVRRAQEHAAQRVEQQRTLAAFAQAALDDEAPLADLFHLAAESIARVLDVPLSRVVRVVAGSDDLEYVAQVGWDDDAPLPGPRSHSYTDFIMHAAEPVWIPDLQAERRFRVPPTLLAHGIRSSLATGLRGTRGPWGLISAHSLTPRAFTEDERNFACELAGTLSLAIAVREAQELQRDTISIASHELRTPLTSVIGLGQHLSRRLTRSGAEESTIEMVQSLTSEAFRLNAILERWMGFAELQTGGAHHALERVDLRDCVTRQVIAARERHGQMEITVRVPDAALELETAPDTLAGILDNLLENAARYAGDAAEVEVSVAQRAPDRIAIVVRDNGPGIAEAHLAHLFERFYRGAGRVKGGLGVGLYVSRGLAEELGGVLTVASRPGEGAAFTLELPLRAPRRAEAPVPAR